MLLVVTEIPIAMVLLARVLNSRANRWANGIAAPITIAFVIGGGSATPHYFFFASIEIVCTMVIMGHVWRWPSFAKAMLA